MSEKKSSVGRAVTKGFLVFGTAAIIGYSVIKGKLLGRPPSKIRKGLLYASVAGLILYKCQGDKVESIVNAASDKGKKIYSQYIELQEKKNERLHYEEILKEETRKNAQLNEQINKLKDTLFIDKKVIENSNTIMKNTVKDYMLKDSALTILMQENEKLRNTIYSEKELQNLSKLQKETEKEIKETIDKKVKEEIKKLEINKQNNNTNYDDKLEKAIDKKLAEKTELNESRIKSQISNHLDDYKIGKELAVVNSGDNYSFYIVESKEHKNWLWIMMDGKTSIIDISDKYYKDKNTASMIADYNQTHLGLGANLPKGMPIALKEKGLITKEGIYKGGFPRFVVFDKKGGLEHLIDNEYNSEPDNLDVLSAIRRYNQIYNHNIDELMNNLGREDDYCVLIPRFLKENSYSCYSEKLIEKNEDLLFVNP